MDNPNSDKVSEARKYKPRALAHDGVLTITKEKLVIVIAMAAFAMVLLAVVILLTFGGDEPLGILKKNHRHDYDMTIEIVGNKVNLIGHCKDESCKDPDFLQKNVSGVTFTDVVLPTCTSEGKRVYALEYDGEELSFEVEVAKSSHFVNGVSADRLENPDGQLPYDGKNIVVTGGELKCENVFPKEQGYFRCSVCGEKVNAAVYIPHMYAIELVREGSSFYLLYECAKVGCEYTKKDDVTKYVTKTEESAATCVSKAVVCYEYSYGGETIEYKEYGELDPDNHALFETAKNADGTYDYVKGFTIHMDGAGITCGGGISNSFHLRCPDCGENGKPGEPRVNLPDDHSFVYVKGDVIKNPTFSEKGKVIISCKYPWCDHEIEVEIDKMTTGEGGNATLVKAPNSIHNGQYRYKTKTEQGIEVELLVTLPK